MFFCRRGAQKREDIFAAFEQIYATLLQFRKLQGSGPGAAPARPLPEPEEPLDDFLR